MQGSATQTPGKNCDVSSAAAAPKREYLVPAEEESDAAGLGEAQKVSLATSPRLRLFAMLINILVISEVAIAMYFANQTPDSLTPVFFKIFFSLLLPTLALAFLGRRHIAKAER